MVNSSIDKLGCIMCSKSKLLMYKWLFIIYFGLSGTGFSWLAHAERVDHGVNRIYAVNHTSHTVIINDETFSMLIGLKVYDYDLKTKQKQQVNRYALRKDQAITYVSEIRNGSRYLSQITILR